MLLVLNMSNWILDWCFHCLRVMCLDFLLHAFWNDIIFCLNVNTSKLVCCKWLQVSDNYYRPDLKKAALSRLSAVHRSLKVTKSGVKQRNRQSVKIPGRKWDAREPSCHAIFLWWSFLVSPVLKRVKFSFMLIPLPQKGKPSFWHIMASVC